MLNLSIICSTLPAVQQSQRMESIQQNNVLLAKRVCDLQKELSDRTEELQNAQKDVFQLEMKLNRLQNSTAEVRYFCHIW